MDTLIIGFGKIGQTKAPIWCALGRTVYVYDNDPHKAALIAEKGYTFYKAGTELANDLVVDISTPAGAHAKALEWTLNNTSLPQGILVEKPLASSPEELLYFQQALQHPMISKIRRNIAINESYYFSTAIAYVLQDIRATSSSIKDVHIELSKNRLIDATLGRFWDYKLGSMGIELPHMLAIVERLGIRLPDLSIDEVNVYSDDNLQQNEGCRIKLSKRDVAITLESFLGDFKVLDSGKVTRNTGIVRQLRISTSSFTYLIEFDPADGLNRYEARIRVMGDTPDSQRTIVIQDNHLKASLARMNSDSYESDTGSSEFITLDNAIRLNQFLFSIQRQAHLEHVSEMSTPLGIKESAPSVLLNHPKGTEGLL